MKERCIEELLRQRIQKKLLKDKEGVKILEADIADEKKELREEKKYHHRLESIQADLDAQRESSTFEKDKYCKNLLLEYEEKSGIYRSGYWDAYTARDSRHWVKVFEKDLRVWISQLDDPIVKKWDEVSNNKPGNFNQKTFLGGGDPLPPPPRIENIFCKVLP